MRRSILYVPADNPRALEKASTLDADAIIVDLEDAVAPERKEAARQAARAFSGFPREVALRINAAGTPWHDADLEAAAGFAAVVLPKVRSAADIAALDAKGACVWPMLETAAGILAAGEIAEAAGRTGNAALILGTNDLAAELGIALSADRAELSHALQTAVLAARAHRLDGIDGVFNNTADVDGLARESAAGRALGMNGKSVIHPAQIDPVNAAFSPQPDEIEAARRIIAAVDAAHAEGRSIAVLDGRMVEALHAEAARAVLSRAKSIETRNT
ncbi:CoA ester lyase [Acuticoccus sp. MNP-M23]|uniref:HpcH/HpaI aldolase/citrate lyase family protein n=1 Tax=Acuticoccus sp. MNP-M23 TaxID=3072793 RepID=UPI002815D44B|nr:CoA ester lyase [Acuticoccus sp. MNP-M23]WMS44093.1 CoA ester lyase [Acuticoccus sp. MNP-M23]